MQNDDFFSCFNKCYEGTPAERAIIDQIKDLVQKGGDSIEFWNGLRRIGAKRIKEIMNEYAASGEVLF